MTHQVGKWVVVTFIWDVVPSCLVATVASFLPEEHANLCQLILVANMMGHPVYLLLLWYLGLRDLLPHGAASEH